MNTDLTGKRALVCGSSAGIGRAAADELAALGAEVTLLARSEDKLRLAAAELPRPAGQLHDYLVADFTRPSEVEEAVRSGLDEARPWLVVVNNTGGPPGGRAIDAGPDSFRAAFESHLICNQLIARLVVPGMTAAGFGRIINIISTSVKAPIPGLGVSNTIRGAVASWAKTLAAELGPMGITVNNVLPGFTDTERLGALFKGKAEKTGKSFDAVCAEAIATIPAGRLGRAEEVAAAVAFLATPAAGYINGVNLPVDGGRTQSL